MEGFYRFADITFRINGNDGDMYQEDGVLAPFRVDGPEFDHCITYEVVESLPKPEGECVFRGERIMVFRNGDNQITCMGGHVPAAGGCPYPDPQTGNGNPCAGFTK